jgi:pimeloyl-ACP methyl ester carboxylesterase
VATRVRPLSEAARTPDPGSSARAPEARRPEQSRARYPDETGFIERDGVRVFWERYGDGSPTVLLMPTWSVFHARHWKLQIPDLARHFRVVTFDGRGNGRSDRPRTAAAYADTEFAADAAAVLDATATDRAVVAGVSMGAGYGLRLAVDHPSRVLGLVMFGASIPVGDQEPGTPPGPDASFTEPPPDDEGWHKYNATYWRRNWPGFADWFARQIFSEPHSTKAIEDGTGWFLDTDPETIVIAESGPFLRPPADWERLSPTEGDALPFLRRVRCPVLVVHGTDDQIVGIAYGRRIAELLGAPLVEMQHGGHSPIGREPVRSNLLLRDFIRGLEARP